MLTRAEYEAGLAEIERRINLGPEHCEFGMDTEEGRAFNKLFWEVNEYERIESLWHHLRGEKQE